LLHITEIVSEFLLLVTERRESFHHERNDSIYIIQTNAMIQEIFLAIKDLFQSHVKAVEILKSGPKI